MQNPELAQLELLSQVDELTERLRNWVEQPTTWQPLQRCRALLRRVLTRVASLRVRLEAPLVVATFGGTGTGKSSLVNALVGTDVTPAGRQRPTTRRPVLIAHSRTELDALELPLDDLEVIRRDEDLLRDIVVLDCPDPDTNEQADAGSNLTRLRRLLPHCDVLIYTSTQEKYRSARVAEELGQAAEGCRLVFVQTHADRDDDIREDWRSHLREHYEVPDVFFVDSQQALHEQQAGQRPTGDVGRLLDLLTTQLAAAERVRIRRSNVLDLIQAGLAQCQQTVEEHLPQIDKLEDALATGRDHLRRRMAERLQNELLASRHLWERRLLGQATDDWGFSPFSAMLRLYNGLGGLLASMSFFRARTSAQVALIGAAQGARWLGQMRQERTADEVLSRAGAIGLDDGTLRESRVVVEGHAQAAEIDMPTDSDDLDRLRERAARVGEDFLGDAASRIDQIIEEVAEKNTKFFTKAWYELLFLIYVLFVVFRIGWNFFYESLWLEEPFLATDFYIPAAIFFVLWSGALVIAYTQRLRRGLTRRINGLARDLVDAQLERGLFPQLEQACTDIRSQCRELSHLLRDAGAVQQRLKHSTLLGGKQAVQPVPATGDHVHAPS